MKKPPWTIIKTVSNGDYLSAVVPGHPRSNRYGYVAEHRIVMENHLDRLLNTDEIVHHINNNSKDNRIENLAVMSNSEHARYHARMQGRTMMRLKCPFCQTIFTVNKQKSFLRKNKKNDWQGCSISCGTKFGKKIKRNGETPEIKKAISEVIIEEYKDFTLEY